MPNSIEVNEQKLLARGLLALRKKAILPMMVNRAYEDIAGQKGSTVTVPVSRPKVAYDVAATANNPATADSVQDSVQIPCNNWKGSDFYVTDLDRINTDPQFIDMEMAESTSALANVINTAIARESRKFFGFVGTAGTTPLASNPNDIIQARRRLIDQLTPTEDLYCAWSPAAEANALALPAFQYVNQGGNDSIMTEGDLGRRLGFDHKVVQDLYRHTTGGGAGWLVNQVGHAVGANTVTIDTGSGAPVEGDLFTVAGSTQQYVVRSFASNVITYYPRSPVAFADNAAITFVPSHENNIAMHKNAIAFVSRPLLTNSDEGLGSRFYSMRDPVSGLVMRLEVSRQNKQVRYEFDILYGVQVIRPEYGVRILG